MRIPMKALAVAAVALIALTACEKPKPAITVFSGTNSVHMEALCWGAEPATGCDANSITSTGSALTVKQGSTVGISVDSDVADAGWVPQLVINGQAQTLTTSALHRRYWKMEYPETAGTSLMGKPLTLRVIAITADGQSARGVWSVALSASENPNNA